MKKIGFVNPDSSLITWIMEQLENAPADYEGVWELSEALRELLAGEYASLLMEVNGEDPAPPEVGTLQCGELSINVKARRVTRGDLRIELTPKEFDILYFLASHRGEVFTREQIYEAVWDDKFAQGDSNIMTFIRRIRKKVEPNPDDPIYILTVWGIGYKFTEER